MLIKRANLSSVNGAVSTQFEKNCINKPDDKYTADNKVFYTNSLRASEMCLILL